VNRSIILSILFITLVCSTPSNAKWVKVAEAAAGPVTYIDYKLIKKKGRYIYYWMMIDFVKPHPNGSLSVALESKADCKLLRSKSLLWIYYENSMGRGTSHPYTPTSPKWTKMPANSAAEVSLKTVCEYSN
jgi:hypothetical protein